MEGVKVLYVSLGLYYLRDGRGKGTVCKFGVVLLKGWKG